MSLNKVSTLAGSDQIFILPLDTIADLSLNLSKNKNSDKAFINFLNKDEIEYDR